MAGVAKPQTCHVLDAYGRCHPSLGDQHGHPEAKDGIQGGFLENKVHYNLGPSKNSAITWNVALVRDAFNERGLQARYQQGVS